MNGICDLAAARVIVNSRTGSVVVGPRVRVTPAAVAHGSLSVTITERADVSQPVVHLERQGVARLRSVEHRMPDPVLDAIEQVP